MEILSPRATAFFWSQVQIETAHECWLWRGYKNGTGYGYYGKTKPKRVHRLAYLLLVGPIPDGLTIDHLCKNRLCVNPSHMEVVSAGANTLRGNGPTAKNARKVICQRGHPFQTRKNGKPGRFCAICNLEGNRRWRLRTKNAALTNVGNVTT